MSIVGKQAAICFALLVSTALAQVSPDSRPLLIQGIVLEDHSGTPVVSATVRVLTRTGAKINELETDQSGRFEIKGLASGEYRLIISKSNYVTVNASMTAQTQTMSPDAAGRVPVLRLISYGEISGHISSPRTGGYVTAIEEVSEGRIPRSYVAVVNGNGEFRVAGITPGRYRLVAPFIANDNGPNNFRGLANYPTNTNPREFVISGGEQYDGLEFAVVINSLSSIRGRIVVPDVPIIYPLMLVESEHPSIRLLMARTGMDGTFHFDNIFPGTYDLTVSGPPPSFFGRVHLVLNSQNEENIEISLRPGHSAEFALRVNEFGNPNSACSADGTITLQALGNWGTVRDQSISVRIVPAIPVRIENLAPDRFNVAIRSSSGGCIGVTPETLDLIQDVSPERAIVVFQPPGTIRGTTADMASSVVLRDVTPGRESPVQAVFTASNSDFQFDGLTPGRYCLAAQSSVDTIPHWSQEPGCPNPIIDLSAGESRVLQFELFQNPN
jgi:hypothetical protein